VNMKAKTAIHRVPSKPAGPLSPDYLKGVTVNNSGQDTVDGITCYRVTPTVLYPDGRQERSGEFCESAQYGLTLRSIMDLTSPQDGVTHRTIREMYEVRIGASPDAKLFDLSSLEIYKMEKEPTKP
ncbi:MAG TPA: hypothetical protein VFP96_08315, partial [Candidatus Acidoferrum sp.]|nr:hypothetical protein [Candidatus Acidoferrum sp.]